MLNGYVFFGTLCDDAVSSGNWLHLCDGIFDCRLTYYDASLLSHSTDVSFRPSFRFKKLECSTTCLIWLDDLSGLANQLAFIRSSSCFHYLCNSLLTISNYFLSRGHDLCLTISEETDSVSGYRCDATEEYLKHLHFIKALTMTTCDEQSNKFVIFKNRFITERIAAFQIFQTYSSKLHIVIVFFVLMA